MKIAKHNGLGNCFRPGLVAALLMQMGMARADVKPAPLFSDHAVIQCGEKVAVWGTANPGERVSVSYLKETETCVADSDGNWKLEFKPMAAGLVGDLEMAGDNTVIAKDVMTGEVWLCSGQSNMARPLPTARDADREIAAANHPTLRMFVVDGNRQAKPTAEFSGRWLVCSPENATGFSATAYFFGRELQQSLDVPVGLIVSAVGSTQIQSWISVEALKQLPFFEKLEADRVKDMAVYERKLSEWKAGDVNNPESKRPKAKFLVPFGSLFNGMIFPLTDYGIRGVVWYQGEANSKSYPGRYGEFLSALIRDWRQRWGKELPIAWVQLPNYRKAQNHPVEVTDTWPLIREGMLQALKMPHTGMVVALDIGDASDIHPSNKQEVGKRLGMWALAKVYEKKGAVFSGPLPLGFEMRNNEIVVSFSNVEGGLVARDGKLDGFAIAGDDRNWVWADARIVENRVIVSNPQVKRPSAVRYAWANNPIFSLYNTAGLPASPFRSDDDPLPDGEGDHDR